MTQTLQPQITPQKCFVAMFDIIGFKALRKARGTAALHQQFTRGILPMIQHAAAGKGKVQKHKDGDRYVPDFTGSRVRFRIISDTVIFSTPTDSFDDFIQIVCSAHALLQSGFSGGKAPYRGAIGWGDLIDRDGVMIGSAVEDAYLGEASQAWAGAMLTAECLNFTEKAGYIEKFKAVHLEVLNDCDEATKETVKLNSRRLVRYAVPTQDNPKDSIATYRTLDTYVVDWTIRMYEGAALKSFDPSNSRHAQTIAANTQAFEDWARKHNRDSPATDTSTTSD